MKEAELYFNFLLYVSAADGEANNAEIEFIKNAMSEIGISDEISQNIKEKINFIINGRASEGLDEVIEGIGLSDNPYFILNVLKDSFALAASDSKICDNELKVIKNLLNCLTPQPDEIFEEMKSWAMRTITLEEEGVLLLDKAMSKEI